MKALVALREICAKMSMNDMLVAVIRAVLVDKILPKWRRIAQDDPAVAERLADFDEILSGNMNRVSRMCESMSTAMLRTRGLLNSHAVEDIVSGVMDRLYRYNWDFDITNGKEGFYSYMYHVLKYSFLGSITDFMNEQNRIEKSRTLEPEHDRPPAIDEGKVIEILRNKAAKRLGKPILVALLNKYLDSVEQGGIGNMRREVIYPFAEEHGVPSSTVAKWLTDIQREMKNVLENEFDGDYPVALTSSVSVVDRVAMGELMRFSARWMMRLAARWILIPSMAIENIRRVS